MIRKVCKLLTPILSAVIGILCANQFNIFTLFTFVSQENAYEYCITAYFAIADIILEEFIKLVEKLLASCVGKVEAIIYPVSSNADIASNAVLDFNSEGLAEIRVLVKITGNRKYFRNTELQIKSPAFIDIQGTKKEAVARTNSEGYSINLYDLFGKCEKTSFEQTFRIVMAQAEVEGDCTAKIEPEIKGKHLNVMYKHNYLQIRAGVR